MTLYVIGLGLVQLTPVIATDTSAPAAACVTVQVPLAAGVM